MTPIAVIEDNLYLRQSLSEFFQHSTRVECVLAVDTVEKFLKFHRDFMQIKLILLDVKLFEQTSLPFIPQIRQREPNAEIIVFSVMDDFDTIFQAICNGATGYLIKGIPYPELEEKIVSVVQNEGALLSPMIAKRILSYFTKLPTAKLPLLSEKAPNEKEMAVIRLLIDGHTYESIAQLMNISLNGVRYYVKNIYRKLHVNSRNELARLYRTNELEP